MADSEALACSSWSELAKEAGDVEVFGSVCALFPLSPSLVMSGSGVGELSRHFRGRVRRRCATQFLSGCWDVSGHRQLKMHCESLSQ